jgi:acyl-CoA dehydrogenase
MNEEIALFRDQVRRFAEVELAPHVERWRKQGFVDREYWRKAGGLGFLLPELPEEYGGAGASAAYQAVLLEEFTRAGAVPHFQSAVHTIVAHYILAYGTEDQKRGWLPNMASGEWIGAIAMTEPGAGSDLQGIRTSAVRHGDHYLINGSKTFISNGLNCDVLGIVAKTDPAQGAKGISLIFVETGGLKGFKRGRLLDKIGLKGQDTMELFFEDMRAPVANVLGGREGQGFYQLMEQLPYERTVISILAVAAMECAVELTTQYAKQRSAFGKPLLEMQNTRFKLAECKTVAHASRIFVDHCIERLVEGTMDAVTASMAKWWVTENQCKVIDECLQLHGGYGYMLESPIAQLYVDARAQRIYGGANEIMKELIARSL